MQHSFVVTPPPGSVALPAGEELCQEQQWMAIQTFFSGKWRLILLYKLDIQPYRFNDLQSELGISSKMLSTNLRLYEDTGIVRRMVQVSRPVSVAYELTEHGRDVIPIIRSLIDWAAGLTKRYTGS